MLPLRPSTQGPGKSVTDTSHKSIQFAAKLARGSAPVVSDDPVAALNASNVPKAGEPTFFADEARILAATTAEEELEAATRFAADLGPSENTKLKGFSK